MFDDDLLKQLTPEEGDRLKPYTDTVGKVTIGRGRNLTDKGISEVESVYLCMNDIADVKRDLNRALPWWINMPYAQQLVLADMCFNMGITRLMGFHDTLAAMQRGDYAAAAAGMQNSQWYSQVGARGVKLVNQMRTGGLS